MVLKKVILLAFVIMITGTILELYLLNHYEDRFQLIPIVCIGFLAVNAFILVFNKSRRLKGLFKLILMVTALSGVYGVYLHLKSNFEFEVEMTPNASNWDLLVESLSGALPTLAPFSMIVLALLGYSYLILINQKQ